MRDRFMRGLPLLALVMASALAVGIAAGPPRPPAKPVQVVGGVMDSPIPPGAPEGVQVTKGTGYCVTYVTAGVVNRVDVPFHKPDPAKLDELRGSLHNALELIANQLDVKIATMPAGEQRGELASEAGKLHAQLAHGVHLGGEPGVSLSPETSRPVMVGPGGGVACVCATLCGDACGAANYCGGACGGCWKCGS